MSDERLVKMEQPVSGLSDDMMDLKRSVSDERLARVEERVSGLSDDMSDLKKSLYSISESLKILAVLEERHRSADEALGRIFTTIEKNTEKIKNIEILLPNMSLASSWVFKAAVAIVAFTGFTYIATAIRTFVR